MSKKWKILLIIIASIVVLALGGTAIVMAQDNEPATASNPLLARIAQLLGKTEAQLTDAIKSARIEVAKEAAITAIDKAVTSGTLTTDDQTALVTWINQLPDPSDAAAMKTWWQSRPEISKPGLYNRLLGIRFGIFRGWCHKFGFIGQSLVADKVAAKLGVTKDQLVNAFNTAAQEMKTNALQKALSNAVGNGKLTQSEVDQITTWWSQRPAVLDKLAPGFPFGGFHRGFCR